MTPLGEAWKACYTQRTKKKWQYTVQREVNVAPHGDARSLMLLTSRPCPQVRWVHPGVPQTRTSGENTHRTWQLWLWPRLVSGQGMSPHFVSSSHASSNLLSCKTVEHHATRHKFTKIQIHMHAYTLNYDWKKAFGWDCKPHHLSLPCVHTCIHAHTELEPKKSLWMRR